MTKDKQYVQTSGINYILMYQVWFLSHCDNDTIDKYIYFHPNTPTTCLDLLFQIPSLNLSWINKSFAMLIITIIRVKVGLFNHTQFKKLIKPANPTENLNKRRYIGRVYKWKIKFHWPGSKIKTTFHQRCVRW